MILHEISFTILMFNSVAQYVKAPATDLQTVFKTPLELYILKTFVTIIRIFKCILKNFQTVILSWIFFHPQLHY